MRVIKVSFDYDNGCVKERCQEIIISPTDLSEKEVAETLRKISPYNQYDTTIYNFVITPAISLSKPYVVRWFY